MWSLVAKLASSAGGILAMLAIVAGLIGTGAYEEHKIDAGKLATVEANYAKAQAAAVAQAAQTQKAIDNAALDAANQEATAQAAQAATLQQELSYVKSQTVVLTKTVPCVPYLLVRLLDAAILGVSADSLTLPAGKSDNTCTALSAADLAGALVKNLNLARANAEQLNALIALIKTQQIALQEKK